MSHGLNWEKERADQKDTDYVFGAASPKCIALIPQEDREKYLPAGELQRGIEDFEDCATRSPLNELEAKFTYLFQNHLISEENRAWLFTKGYADLTGRVTFSDRFIAIKSGTTRNGNSLIAPLQAIHSCGLIPKKLLPAKPTMSFDMYHRKSDITVDMDVLGMQFLNRFPIGYERVPLAAFPLVIDEDIIGVAGYAWPAEVNGEYPAVPASAGFNHAFAYFKTPRYYIFDNYPEAPDDWIKKLADDYILSPYGYRVYVSEQQVKIDRGILDLIIAFLVQGKTTQAMALISKQLGSWTSAGSGRS